MVRLYLVLTICSLLGVSGCTVVSSAQNSNRLTSCAQGREAIDRNRAQTERVSEVERGPKPTINPQDGAVASVASLMQRRVAVPDLRDTYRWSEVTPFEVPARLPPWIKGSYWSVRVSYCRENSSGAYIASNEYWALIRNNKVVWFDLAPQKIAPSEDAGPLFASEQPVAKPNSRPKVAISSIKAMPFNEHTGLLGDDVLASGKGTFWNAVRTSLLVLVELSGERGSYDSHRQVEFTARVDGRESPLILRRVSNVGVLNENGKYYASFYLYGGFCQPIALEARILGESQSLKKTIDFQCGE